ncbi:MAG TPA: hypothetical protein VGW40_01335 [Allosphingosinicella sp.]|nr:hypothetical protein [Allosphingosinicella sp.]
MRAVAGIIVGVIAGFVATILFAILAISLTAPSVGRVDVADPRQVVEAFAAMPQSAKIALMAAWLVGALVGAAIGKLIARRGWVAWTIAALIALYVVLNVLILPLPGWMQALSIAAPLIGGLLANHLVKDAAPAVAETAGTPPADA